MALSKVTETVHFCRKLIAVPSVYLVCNSILMNTYTMQVCVTDNMGKKHYSEKIEVFLLKNDFLKTEWQWKQLV